MFANEGANNLQDGLVKVLQLLDQLKQTSGDSVYVEHIRQMLLSSSRSEKSREQLFHGILMRLIEGLESTLDQGSPLTTELTLLKIHLAPPVTPEDIEVVRSRLEMINLDLQRSAKVDLASLHRIFQPLVPDSTPQKEWHGPDAAGAARPHAQAAVSEHPQAAQEIPAASVRPDEINQVRDDFSRHVHEAIAQNDEFGVLLDVELNALQEARTEEDIEGRRQVLIKEVENFMSRHRLLSKKFDKASRYLQLMETDNQQLTDELDRVRLLSLTDELTGLPNRRAFMKRLEDEVGRVNRYGYPISLVLIDLDEFKAVNDAFGHAGGDAVLKCYAEYVLSAFRHHDMVCRYGGEEFAVLLPNTSEEGSMRALEKARDYALKTGCMHNGEHLSMPTFSAGLAQYRHGELPTAFIERADSALYLAKRLGRNRIEIAENEGENKEEYRSRQG